MASRMRCSLCHADSFVMPYFREISHAETEFLEDTNSKITNSQVRMLILVPWKIVSVRTGPLVRAASVRRPLNRFLPGQYGG